MVKKLLHSQRFDSMRGWFAWSLHNLMVANQDIWVVTGDLGYGVFDTIEQSFPKRFINVGAAEQAMMGIGVGLALEGKVPVVYSITSFLLYRPFETIRNYVHNEKIPVKLVGSGRDRDYQHDGFSHWAEEDKKILEILSNIEGFWPETKEEIPPLLREILLNRKPVYLNLRR